jgi:thiamine kinase-like enzyme
MKVVLSPLVCNISGDPNPTNWGIRDNGDLVLFDFERIGYGNPAIDLAITIPGFGDPDGLLEYEIAETYISYWHNNPTTFPFSINELARQIHLGKFWSALDFLSNNLNTMDKQVLISFTEKLTEIMKIKVKNLS